MNVTLDGDSPRPVKVVGHFGYVQEGGVWKVTEVVTPQGHWITHMSAYKNKEQAKKAARAAFEWYG